ncbi:Mg2+ transporter protein CorA-like/Zinc transport protein ZntB [Penicillium herquei]|nr:Mg2+ transporter protein CorA-like/Zinc transport protein ZntB [Penicillium herquei]
MPYLFWGVKPNTENQKRQSPAANLNGTQISDSERPGFGFKRNKIPVHHSLTLDQYYYAALEDTKDRDRDQVFSRYFQRLYRVKKKTNTVDGTGKELKKASNTEATEKTLSEKGEDFGTRREHYPPVVKQMKH